MDEGILDSFMHYAGILLTVSSVVSLISPYFSRIIRKMKYEKTETIANIKFDNIKIELQETEEYRYIFTTDENSFANAVSYVENI